MYGSSHATQAPPRIETIEPRMPAPLHVAKPVASVTAWQTGTEGSVPLLPTVKLWPGPKTVKITGTPANGWPMKFFAYADVVSVSFRPEPILAIVGSPVNVGTRSGTVVPEA